MNFEFDIEHIANNSIEIDDIGNICLVGVNERGLEYYLIIKSDLGIVQTIEYGPLQPDFEQLPPTVNYQYSRFEWNQVKVLNTIKSFLNNSKYALKQVEIISIDEVKQLIRNMVDFI